MFLKWKNNLQVGHFNRSRIETADPGHSTRQRSGTPWPDLDFRRNFPKRDRKNFFSGRAGDMSRKKWQRRIGRSLLAALFAVLLIVLLLRSERDVFDPRPADVPGTRSLRSAEHVVRLEEGDARVSYHWRLYDLYDQRDFILLPKAEPPRMVSKSHVLRWRKDDPDLRVFLEFSESPDFIAGTKASSRDEFHAISSVRMGSNYWRASIDRQTWSEPLHFSVEPRFLSDPPPQLETETKDVPFLGEMAFAPIRLKSSFRPLGFVMEASESPLFEPEKTKTFWANKSEFRLSFFREGDYYYRFRAVNLSQEMTEWSMPAKFAVRVPSSLNPAVPEIELFERPLGEMVDLAWSGDPRASLYVVEVRNEAGKIVESITTPGSPSPWTSSAAGHFQARIFSLDRHGRRSLPSRPVRIHYFENAVPWLARGPAGEFPDAPDQIREGSVATRVGRGETARFNDSYRSNRVELEGSAWTLQSKEQAYRGAEPPISTGIGVRLFHWWDQNGIEASYKTKALDANATGGEVSPQQLEARYHRRFVGGVPFNLARELEMTLFAGFEMYRNSGSTLFSAEYDLFKFGTSIEFPLGNRWDTGGEFVYGIGTDSSRKYEISGNFHYFLNRDWSLGAGYRVHLFEAGSPKASPVRLLPYREGYTEGFSVLRFHY